ncbi:hypothetical protein [Flavobacterium denitrificans]|uniref:hypothetical protein n=1 Tax=Flavobacterium denitrificans TaxID=281361 RepID=UPI000404F04F|nr:hypothetical protein [Flavobacterium denitrificans]
MDFICVYEKLFYFLKVLEINSYLIEVVLPFGLKTNYGVELNFHAESKGTAEIITEDRRLIERFFDNSLRYELK